jgi:hypothetical protein
MKRQSLSPTQSSPAFTAIAWGLLSTMATATTLLVVVCGQLAAQRPARQGVLVFHLGRQGELRLWNQPIRHQEVPVLLERARWRARGGPGLVVRLVPEPQVPWGVVQRMLTRLRPPAAANPWSLQLQLP